MNPKFDIAQFFKGSKPIIGTTEITDKLTKNIISNINFLFNKTIPPIKVILIYNICVIIVYIIFEKILTTEDFVHK